MAHKLVSTSTARQTTGAKQNQPNPSSHSRSNLRKVLLVLFVTLTYLQAISMAVQRGNVQCVQGAYGEPAFEELDEIFYIVKPNNIF